MKEMPLIYLFFFFKSISHFQLRQLLSRINALERLCTFISDLMRIVILNSWMYTMPCERDVIF